VTNEGSQRPSAPKRGIGNIIGGFVAGLYSVPEGIGYASLAAILIMGGQVRRDLRV